MQHWKRSPRQALESLCLEIFKTWQRQQGPAWCNAGYCSTLGVRLHEMVYRSLFKSTHLCFCHTTVIPIYTGLIGVTPDISLCKSYQIKIEKYKFCTSDRLMSNMGHNHEIYGPQIEVAQNELQEGWITSLCWSFSQAGVKFHNGLKNSTRTQLETETDGNISTLPI